MKCPYVMRKCNTCGKWLVASNINFHKEKNGKYGLRGQCKKCKKEYADKNKQHKKEYDKKRYEDNRESMLEQSKIWKENNREHYLEQKRGYAKGWYKKNAEYKKNYNKSWRKDNPEKVFNQNNKRRLKEESQGNGFTNEQWYEMFMFFDFRCAYSGEYLGNENNKKIRSIDHIISLDNNGEHEIWNLVPMLKSYNSSKGTKDMLEWYLEQPFFSIERLTKIYEWRIYAYEKWGKEVA